jgi:CheY-like chemotaxis protein
MIDDADCRDVLEQQEQAIDAMSRLLNALLDISKLESGAIKLELTDFELTPLLDEMRREFAGIATNKGLKLSFAALRALVRSDPALISQVLRNLISNALKYTQSGSVEVRCQRRAALLRIEVRDSGVGIAADQVPFIFDEFYQIGVSPNSSRDGYGLGLSIVQRIAKLLAMPVTVQSVVGQGSTFSFELPLCEQTDAVIEKTGGSRDRAANHGSGFQVLLVEDEPGVRNAMRMLLKIEGYQVVTAASATEAVEHLRANGNFDLVVTDFHLEGGRTGTEVIAAAREILGVSLKAVLVTGDTSSAVRELQGDVNLRIISKPINSDDLLGLIKLLLSG